MDVPEIDLGLVRYQGARPVRQDVEGIPLRGQVASDYEKNLAERLAMLEPGVSAVRNELELAPPTDAP